MVNIFRTDLFSKFGGEEESFEGVKQGIIDHEDLIPRKDSDEDRESIKDTSVDSNNVKDKGTKPAVFKQLSSYVVLLPLALGAIGLSVMTNTAGITTYLTSSFSSALVQKMFEASFIGAAGLLPPTVTTTLYNAKLTPFTSSENSEKQTDYEESESDEFEYRFNDSDFDYADKEKLYKERSFKGKKIDRKFVPITNSTVEGDGIEKDDPTNHTISTDKTPEEAKSKTSKTRSTEEKANTKEVQAEKTEEEKANTTEVQAEKTEEEKAEEEKALKKELLSKIRKEGEKAGEDDVTVITTPLEKYENGTFQQLERYLFSARPELDTREDKGNPEYLPNLSYVLQQVLTAYVNSGIELEGIVNGVKKKDFKSILEKLVVDGSILKTRVMQRPYGQVLELLHMIKNNIFYREEYKKECEQFKEEYKARFLKEMEAYRKAKDEGNTDIKEPLSFDQYSAVMLNNRKEIIDDLAKFYTEIRECDEVLVTAAGSTRDIRKARTESDIINEIRESSKNSNKYKYVLAGSLIATLGIGSLCLSGFSVAPVIAYVVPSSIASWLGIGTTSTALVVPKTTAVGLYYLQNTLIHNLPSAIATLGTSTAAAGAYQAGQAGQFNAKTSIENIQHQFDLLGIKYIDTLNPPAIGDIYNNASCIANKVIGDANLGTNPYLDAGFVTKAWDSLTDYSGQSFGFIHNKLREACMHVVNNPDGIAATTLKGISLATTGIMSSICACGVYNRFFKKSEEQIQLEIAKDEYEETLKSKIEESKRENKPKTIATAEVTRDEFTGLTAEPMTVLTVEPINNKSVNIYLDQKCNQDNVSISRDRAEISDPHSSEEHGPSTSTAEVSTKSPIHTPSTSTELEVGTESPISLAKNPDLQEFEEQGTSNEFEVSPTLQGRVYQLLTGIGDRLSNTFSGQGYEVKYYPLVDTEGKPDVKLLAVKEPMKESSTDEDSLRGASNVNEDQYNDVINDNEDHNDNEDYTSSEDTDDEDEDLNSTVREREPVASTSTSLSDQDLTASDKDEDKHRKEQNDHKEGEQEQKKN